MTHAPFVGVPQSDYGLLHPEKGRGKAVLTIRTDKPEAEIGLYSNGQQLAVIKWQAHWQLAETIHTKIDEILNKSSISLDDIQGIIAFKGPGSFTGLRIGLSVANALAYSLQIPIVGVSGENWIEQGTKKLAAGANSKLTLPLYGSAPRTTAQRK